MSIKSLFTYRGKSTWHQDLVMAVISFVGFFAFWQMICFFEVVQERFLPSPLTVMIALWTMFAQYDLLTDIGVSVGRVWGAFLLSVITAIPIGMWMSNYRIVGSLVEPIVDFIRYLPIPALVPLLIIWFGIGESSKIAVLWMGTFFQLVLLIADDAKRVPKEFIELGYTLGAKPSNITRDIVLRSILPSMVDNLRICLGWCWTWIILAEIVAANTGIGHVIWSMRRFVKTPEVMAGILTIGVIGLLTDQAIRFFHNRYFRYL